MQNESIQTIDLAADITLNSSISTSNNKVIRGNGYTLDLVNSVITGNNLQSITFENCTITSKYGSQSLRFWNGRVKLKDMTFTQNAGIQANYIDFMGIVSIPRNRANEMFYLNSGIEVHEGSNVEISNNNSGGHAVIGFWGSNSQPSIIIHDKASFRVSDNHGWGIIGANGGH